MFNAYPVVMTKDDDGYLVYVPDFDCNTQGKTAAEAIRMARDVIELMGVDYLEDKKTLPNPTPIKDLSGGDIITLVDVDFEAYKRKIDNRTVRKNLTIPSWLNVEAEKAGLNFSAVLQGAIKEQLGL